METLHRKALVEELQRSLNLSPNQAYFLVRDVFDIITDELEHGNKVRISGFGNFELRAKKKRPGRNIITKQPVEVTSRTVVLFKPGVKVRREIKANSNYLLKKFGIGTQ